MEPEFSPQLIRFGQSQSVAQARVLDFGPDHQALQAAIAAQGADALPAQIQALAALESEHRTRWLESWSERLRQSFGQVIEVAEDPAAWSGAAAETLRQALLTSLEALRTGLQSEYLPLCEQRELSALQRFATVQLTRLDALRLQNSAACEKSREAAAAIKPRLLEAQALPAELLALAALDRLLDTAVRYLFAWEVAKGASHQLEHHLSTLQRIALTGLRPPQAPEPPAAQGPVWSWIEGAWRNDLGVPLSSLQQTYGDWLKRGLGCLKRASRQAFSDPSLLHEALSCLYAAHSVARDRPEALVALACTLTLIDRPQQAVDCLELALKREAMPEIKELFWLIQALDPVNQRRKRV